MKADLPFSTLFSQRPPCGVGFSVTASTGYSSRRKRGRVNQVCKNSPISPNHSPNKKTAADPVLAERETQARQNAWYEKVDPGSKPESAWSAADLDTSEWKTMTLPAFWESAGHPDFDGVFWFRRAFDLPQNWDGGDLAVGHGGQPREDFA